MESNIGKLFLLINILLIPISTHVVNIKQNLFNDSKVMTVVDSPDQCIDDDFGCTEDSQCCSKACISIDLVKIQFCDKSLNLEMSTEKPITFVLENCRPNDSFCEEDDQCCSKQCLPIGTGKFNACTE